MNFVDSAEECDLSINNIGSFVETGQQNLKRYYYTPTISMHFF